MASRQGPNLASSSSMTGKSEWPDRRGLINANVAKEAKAARAAKAPRGPRGLIGTGPKQTKILTTGERRTAAASGSALARQLRSHSTKHTAVAETSLFSKLGDTLRARSRGRPDFGFIGKKELNPTESKDTRPDLHATLDGIQAEFDFDDVGFPLHTVVKARSHGEF